MVIFETFLSVRIFETFWTMGNFETSLVVGILETFWAMEIFEKNLARIFETFWAMWIFEYQTPTENLTATIHYPVLYTVGL